MPRLTDIDVLGTDDGAQKPVDCHITWMYPKDGSTLTIDICHVRCVSDIRIRFDFDTHEWVAEQEEIGFFDTGYSPPSGIWVEVARWPGNSPRSANPGPGRNEVPLR
jgi:hypothetical protein